jgi:rhamnogalacturonan endolyase
MDHSPRGAAVLRLAFSGADTPGLQITVNGHDAGAITGLQNTGAVHRDGMGGAWQEKDLTFDASLLKQGDNNLQLILPGGSVTNGLIYDYLRLELNEQMTVDGKTL